MGSAQKFAARAELRKLAAELDDHRAQLTDTASTGLADAQRRANSLFETAQSELVGQTLDATILSKVSHLGAEQAGNLDRQADAYVRKLRAAFGQADTASAAGGDALNWRKLGDAVDEARIFAHVPALTFVMGNSEVAVTRQSRQSQKRVVRQATEPQMTAEAVGVTQLQESADDKAQLSRVSVLNETLVSHAEANGGSVNLFRLLLHPTSFSQTVENFFDMAFLVKEGRAEIVQREDDCAFASPAVPPDVNAYGGGIARRQNIVKLDYPTYRELVSRWCVEGESPLLAPRSS